MADLQPGQLAPTFHAQTNVGEVDLRDLRGKIVVLFFYPKDNTPGCTKEAKAFRDHLQAFADLGAVVYGVSRGSVQSHQKFADKHGLNMPLISDPDGKICSAYGVVKDKWMFGKKVVGIERSTFIVNRDGTIAKVFRKVKVDGHVEQVLAAVREMQ